MENKKIRQIEVTEALELAKNNTPVFVIKFVGKPIIKNLNTLSVREALADNGDYMFIVFEEA